jgi:hypothetical protein
MTPMSRTSLSQEIHYYINKHGQDGVAGLMTTFRRQLVGKVNRPRGENVSLFYANQCDGVVI